MKEITLEELQKLSEREYVLIDIRDEGLREYGMLPGAIAVDAEAIESGAAAEQIAQIPAEKKMIFYCQIGRKSRELGEPAVLEGRDYYSLEEGYMGYIRAGLNNEEDQKERQERAELSIRKKFHKQLFTPFAKACKKYELIKEGDRIAVCISGGKDSMLMAKLFQEIRRTGRWSLT